MTAADTTATPLKPREIRVFLSSTFRDMDAERNHLIKQVFPKVRQARAPASHSALFAASVGHRPGSAGKS